MKLSCPHFASSEIPSCTSLRNRRFNNFDDLIAGKKEKSQVLIDFPLILGGCISRSFDTGAIEVNEGRCIACGFCITGCPTQSFHVQDNLVPSSTCGEVMSVDSRVVNILKAEFESNATARRLSFIAVSPLQKSFQSLANFTSFDEEKHLSPWGARLLSFIYGAESECALEVNIALEGKPRAGRLDICVRSGSEIHVLESKKSFKDMMTEARIFDQMLNYKDEINRLLEESSFATKCLLSILVGGEETDLFPFSHPECSSHDSHSSHYLMNWALQTGMKIITAQGLLWLAYRDLTHQAPSSREILSAFHEQPDTLILTSRGVVAMVDSKFKLISIME